MKALRWLWGGTSKILCCRRTRMSLCRFTHLVVAKMDGSRNSSPLPEDFSWDSYPKVFMVPAGQRKPIHFEGDRSVKNLIDFVNTHGSKPITPKADSRGGSMEAVLDL